MATNHAADLAAVYANAKCDVINGLPAVVVSGDIGRGLICTPASLADIHYIVDAVPAKARAQTLMAVLRAAMQKGQAAVKSYDKKNKLTEANVADHKAKRLEAAQTAFAGAINGSVESTFNDGSAVLDEAKRQFIATKVLPYAKQAGKDTSAENLEVLRADIEKNHGESYAKAIKALCESIAADRTVFVARKGAGTDGEKPDTGDFKFE